MSTQPPTAILLRLRELAQLFNSMDPSPFIERDLDADAEEYITSWAREIPCDQECELVIHLTEPSSPARVGGVENAVRRYFATRASFKQLELGQLMRRGRLSLVVGTVFLVGCLLLGRVLANADLGEAGSIVREGLTIVGWVAMWRPLEIYLYDWWPLQEQRRQMETLANIRVRVVMPAAQPETAVPADNNFHLFPLDSTG